MRSFLLSLLLLSTPLLAGAETPNAYSSNPTVATLDGQAITLETLRNKQIQDLNQQLHDALFQQLVEYSVTELAKTHEEIQATPEIEISDAEVESFYNLSGLQSRGTLSQLAPQIRGFMEQQMRAEHFRKQYALAQEKGWVTSYLEPPSEFLLEAQLKTAYIRGNSDAQVMMLEFSDYQCPFCLRVQESIQNLIEAYGDRVAFGYRHFPLTFHTEADEAAVASECAREQGKFEPLHDLLYKRQKAQFPKNLKAYGREIQIKDVDAYDTCIDEDRYRQQVNQDIEDGMALGINGTPGFIIGLYDPEAKTVKGELLSGAQPYQKFVELLEKYLGRRS